METVVSILIQLVSGGIGGLIAGKLGTEVSLGTFADICSGVVGGVAIGQTLSILGLGAPMVGSLSIPGILLSILIGVIGGIVVMLVFATIMRLLGKK